VIRAAIMLGFWALLMPFVALFGFPWTILTGNINFLYRISMWGAMTGVRLAGVRRLALERKARAEGLAIADDLYAQLHTLSLRA